MLYLIPEHKVDVCFEALEDNEYDSQDGLRFTSSGTETWVCCNLIILKHFDRGNPRTTNAVEG